VDAVDRSPTARALKALEVVQDHPGITAAALGDRLGVTSRAARRYVAILREAGIPVESVSGPAGGYRPGRGLRPAPMLFTSAEALGLVMAVLDGHHAAADASEPVGSALAKLMRSLPEAVAARAETVRRATAPAPDRAAARPDPHTTTVLVQACADHRRVRLDYRTESGRLLVVEAEPWAVVVRHSLWYLLCLSLTSEAVRVYRVDRVLRTEVLAESFSPPAGLDPVAAVEEHLGLGWEFDVEVLLDAPADQVVRWLPATMGRVERVDEGSCRLVGSTGNPSGYAADLAHLPVAYRVIVGDEVRAATRALGERLLAAGAG
jgi:predicted DNA-binding transcriptional regulator YafY